MNEPAAAPDEQYAGYRFSFDVELRRLPPGVRGRFVRSTLDERARAFIDRSLLRPAGPMRTLAQRGLRLLVSDFDANALLDMYPMHLLGCEQFSRLLGSSGRFARGLDMGAGNGDVTRELAPLCDQLFVTERSWAMRRCLKRRGFQLARDELVHSGSYDLIACLNVIDRTERPATLLRSLGRMLRSGGKLLLSVPIPVEPFFYSMGGSPPPREALPRGGEQWETSIGALLGWSREQLPGLELAAFTRAPYLSGGDAHRSLYVLDAGVVVLEAHPGPRQD